MLTDVQIAELLVDLYHGPEGPNFSKFAFFESGNGDSGICWALVKCPDELVFALRGSKTFEDWIRDLVALATPFQHNDFGAVHPGFLIGMREAVDEMLAFWDRKTPITITGHSLGAGRAAIATAMFLNSGVPAGMMRRIVFGEPKPGMCELAEFISGVTARSYRNGAGFHHDLVTDVPLTLPPLEGYVHPTPLTLIEQPPASMTAQLLDFFGFHHMPLYVEGVKKLLSAKIPTT